MTEYFEVVDEKDNVIGKARREECHSETKLLHRSIGIIITNSKGEFLFQKRSMRKDTDPGRWVVGVGGHVDSGESYGRAAEREAAEEIGIACRPRFAFKILVEMKGEREMASVYTCTHNGPFRANREEIDGLKFIPKARVIRMLKSGRMAEFDMQIMRRFFGGNAYKTTGNKGKR
jgi:isopentenyldiphosphate isomerase